MGIGGEDFGKHKNRIVLSRDAVARFWYQQFLVWVGRELFGEAKESMVWAVNRGEGTELGVFFLLYSLEGLAGPRLMYEPGFLGTAMGAAPIPFLKEKKLPFLSPNAQRLRSNQAPSALAIKPPHGFVVHQLVEGWHQLQRRPVGLQEGKVRISNKDVEVALDVLKRAMQNIER